MLKVSIGNMLKSIVFIRITVQQDVNKKDNGIVYTPYCFSIIL